MREPAEPLELPPRSKKTIPRLAFVATVCSCQLLLLASVSLAEVRRSSLTWDFAIFFQAWDAIGHGDFNPFVSVRGTWFAEDHGAFIVWPLAMVASIFPSALALKLIQDAFVGATTALVLIWTGELIKNGDPQFRRCSLAFAAAATLANPWLYDGAAYDFHVYAFSAFFTLALARALSQGSTVQACLFAIAALACGDVATSVTSSVALSGLIFFRNRSSRLLGGCIFLGSCCWYVILSHLGLMKGSHFSGGFLPTEDARRVMITPIQGLIGIAQHPDFILRQFHDQASIVYANIAPSGFVGIASPFGFIPGALMLAEGVLPSTPSNAYSYPGDQNVPLYGFLTIGTIWVAKLLNSKLSRRNSKFVTLALLVLSANDVCWFSANYSEIIGHWVRVDERGAHFLDHIQKQISVNDEVIASQGFVGAFAGRRWVYAFTSPRHFPLNTHRSWVLLSARQGNETASREQTYSAVETLLHDRRAKLVAAVSDIWAFRLDTPAVGRLDFETRPKMFDGVLAESDPTPQEILQRRAFFELNQRSPVSLAGWRRFPGWYALSIEYDSTRTAMLQIFDGSIAQTLTTRFIQPGHHNIIVPFKVLRHGPIARSQGIAPFAYEQLPENPADVVGFSIRNRSNVDNVQITVRAFSFSDDSDLIRFETTKGPWNSL